MYDPQSNYNLFNEKMHAFNLPKGVQMRNGQVVDANVKRTPQFDTGVEELAKIVAGLQKDFKRINQCITIDGAKAYANKTNKKGDKRIRPNWSADYADVTGPDGTPDGIDEVVVFDSKGRAKIVNGWTLRKSDMPKRKAYLIAKETAPEKMKEVTYTQFKRDGKTINRKLVNGIPSYTYDLNEIGVPEKYAKYVRIQPRDITAKDYYRQAIFKPLYDKVIRETKERLGLDANGKQIPIAEPMTLAQLFNKAFRYCWMTHIENPAISVLTGIDYELLNQITLDDNINKYDPEYKALMKRIREKKKDRETFDAVLVRYVYDVITTEHISELKDNIIQVIVDIAKKVFNIDLVQNLDFNTSIWGNDGEGLPENEMIQSRTDYTFNPYEAKSFKSTVSSPQSMQSGGDTELRIEDLD